MNWKLFCLWEVNHGATVVGVAQKMSAMQPRARPADASRTDHNNLHGSKIIC